MKTKKPKSLLFLFLLVIGLFIIFLVIAFWQLDKEMQNSYKPVYYSPEDEIMKEKEKEESIKEEEIILNYGELIDKVIIPDDLDIPEYSDDLDEIKSDLANSEVLVAFLNQNFNLDNSTSFIAKDPVDLYNLGFGNVTDVALFAAYILSPNLQLTFVIRYDYITASGEEGSHFVTVFRDHDDSSKYITVGLNGEVEMYANYGSSFVDLVRNEESRLKVKAIRWALFSSSQLDLSEVISPFTWQNLR